MNLVKKIQGKKNVVSKTVGRTLFNYIIVYPESLCFYDEFELKTSFLCYSLILRLLLMF